ncbi:methyltransferase domain-containing protein [Symbioplanes lichenis]|uniref:methyltransferase domain-containing protein n=1 Tax=Symbioplanes lichenis TaxID=1629072 RepID=UPI002738F941|nr:methyltransferase domain-containing protein [Actinoplanes lichenis]
MDQIAYMDTAAATPIGTAYKQHFAARLDLRAGHTVVDLGCGPGTDLGRLAAATPGGRVIGIDRDPRMLAEARRRHPTAEVHESDLHALPLPDAGADRARTDRVLQHVDDPARVLAEARRVLRPGGLLGLAEPDWDTLAVADEDLVTSRAFARFVAGRVRNAAIGRDLVRLCVAAGFEVRNVTPVPVLFRDFATADAILGLRRNADRAVAAGALAGPAAATWVARQERGPVVAGFTCYMVISAAGG